MPRSFLSASLLGFLVLSACKDGPVGQPGPVPGSRVVGNCVMTPSLCPTQLCLPQQNGTFLCACADVPAGESCSPCPQGYRYHGKYSSCEPTCAVVAPTCKTGEICEDFLGVAVCMTGADAGADGPAATDVRPPPGARCSCGSCPAEEACLQTAGERFPPEGGITCGEPEGLRECRQKCGPTKTCPASRPHCVQINRPPNCCGGGTDYLPLCCANADASSVYNCF
jgi:hypothetical protein